MVLTSPRREVVPSIVAVSVVAVKNEAVNIRRCLASLSGFERVIVADSGSTDGTDEIAVAMGAEVVQFKYPGGYPKKRQWVLDEISIQSPWTMMLDADEVVTDALRKEISNTIANTAADGLLIRKGFHFLGRRFKYGGFSHAALILFRSGKARFEHLIDEPQSALDMEVHERVIVDGNVAVLREALIHEDFKGLEAYLDRHNKYSTWEARVRHAFLTTGRWGEDSIRPRLLGNTQERRRFLKHLVMRMPLESKIWFLYHYFVKGGFLEGRPGYIACRIRSNYISDVRAKLFEMRRGD